MAETARKEKAKGKRVVVTNRELWVLGNGVGIKEEKVGQKKKRR